MILISLDTHVAKIDTRVRGRSVVISYENRLRLLKASSENAAKSLIRHGSKLPPKQIEGWNSIFR